MSDTICPHMIPADQCLHCLRERIAKLERVLQDVNNCLREKMPSVALQVIQLAGVCDG